MGVKKFDLFKTGVALVQTGAELQCILCEGFFFCTQDIVFYTEAELFSKAG